MKVLIKSSKIIDPISSHRNEVKNIFIEDGIIKDISDQVYEADIIIEEEDSHTSIGWFDLRGYLADPGLEHKEDLHSGLHAAAAGGYTALACLPNTEPPLQSKSEIEYVLNRSGKHIVDVKPLGATTLGNKGTELSEMYDMTHAGAVGFTDGLKTIWHSSILMKSLQYIQSVDGVIIDHAEDLQLAKNGLIHEGVHSTKLGMAGIPALAEELAITKALEILRYAGGHIHFACISTEKSVALIKAAKEEGLNVTCDIASYQLSFIDEDITGFETNFKVKPPFRSNEDRKALLAGLIDGTIDTVVSNHIPHEEDAKKLEFDQAEFGIISYETSFASILEYVNDEFSLDLLIEKMTHTSRKIIGGVIPSLELGEKANLTVFNPKKKWIVDRSSIQSRSFNTPFAGKEMTGKSIAIINNDQVYQDA